MKRIISLLLAAVMVLSLCACGSSKPQKKSLDELTAEDFQAAAEQLMGEEAETQAPTEVEQKIYQIGETISTMDGLVEFTVNDVSFTEYMTPDNLPTDSNDMRNWQAGEGKIFAFVLCTMNYVGNEKGKVIVEAHGTLDYNDGYEFKLSDFLFNMNKTENNRRGDGIAHFEPLTEDRTYEYRMWERVPPILGSDTESPLLLKLVVYSQYGSDYKFPSTEYTIQLR